MTNDTQRADDADALAARAGDAGGLQPLAEFALEAKGLAAGRAERDRRAGNNGEPPQYLSDQPDALYNVEAEAAVLGAAMQFPRDAAKACDVLIAKDFYHLRHRRIFKAMLAVAATGADVDPWSMWAEFERTGQTGNVGGVSWAADLMAEIPTNTGMASSLAIVQQLGAKRRRHALAQRVATASRAEDTGELGRVLRDELATLEASADGPAPLKERVVGSVVGDLPEREWLVPGWLPVNEVTLFYGQGGAGKSALCLQLACAIAGDGEHEHWPAGEHGLRVPGEAEHVVVANYEDTLDDVEVRQRALVKHGYKPAMRENIGDRVHAVHLAGEGPLWTPGRFGDIGKAEANLLDTLAACAAKHEAKLIVVDPLFKAFGGNEIDRSQVGEFVTRLSCMAHELKVAILVVSHPAKGAAGAERKHAGEDPSGSSTWLDGVRSAWRLREETMPGNAGDDEKVLALTLRKSNHGLPGAKVFLESPEWPLYKALNPYVPYVVPPGPQLSTAPQKPSANGHAGHGRQGLK